MPEAETKEPKHTLPWAVFDRRNAPLKNIVVGPSILDLACEVFPVHQRDHMGGFNGDHAFADSVDAIGLANAKLIARSVNSLPDLIKAAEAALRVIYRATPMVDSDDESVDKVVRDLADDMDTVRNQLTAAIAAAKEE